MNNPLLLKDKNGRYPVKSEVTGMEWDTYSPVYLARLYERVAGGDLPNSDILGVLKDYGHQNVRYAYTEKVGWLDMEHFFAAASTAYVTGYQDAIDLGGAVEIAQQAVLEIQQRTGQTINSSFAASAYSFEDLTSNTVGAYFGAYYLPEKEKTGMNVSQALDEYFQKLGVASKEDALKNHSKVTIGGYTEWELPEGYTAEHDHPKSNQSATSKEDLDLIVKFDSLKGHN